MFNGETQEDKEAMQKKIEKDTADFLKNGGEVSKHKMSDMTEVKETYKEKSDRERQAAYHKNTSMFKNQTR